MSTPPSVLVTLSVTLMVSLPLTTPPLVVAAGVTTPLALTSSAFTATADTPVYR